MAGVERRSSCAARFHHAAADCARRTSRWSSTSAPACTCTRRAGASCSGSPTTTSRRRPHTAHRPRLPRQVFLLAFERLPKLEDAEYRAGWGGLYEDTPDHNAILGEAPGVRGFWLANGFSGHGFMHSPAVGMVIADLVTGRPPRADVSALALERFERSALVAEANVI
jgi:glycine/D-amino acid oxidase-like deaminating enzyme